MLEPSRIPAFVAVPFGQITRAMVEEYQRSSDVETDDNQSVRLWDQVGEHQETAAALWKTLSRIY